MSMPGGVTASIIRTVVAAGEVVRAKPTRVNRASQRRPTVHTAMGYVRQIVRYVTVGAPHGCDGGDLHLPAAK